METTQKDEDQMVDGTLLPTQSVDFTH